MKFSFIKYLIFISLVSFLFSCKPDDIEPTPEDIRDNVIGTWKCVENSTVFGEQTFSVNISKDGQDSSKVIFDNFYNLGFGKTVYFTISNYNINIPVQTVPNDGHVISGNGTITSNYKTMNLSYSANDGSGSADNVTAAYTKQ